MVSSLVYCRNSCVKYTNYSPQKEYEGIYNMPIGFAPLLLIFCSPFASV